MKPQHRDLLDARAWNGTDGANDPPDGGDWDESIFDLDGIVGDDIGWETWEPFVSDFAEYPDDVNHDVGPDPPLYGAPWDQRGREHITPWLEEDYGDGAEAGAKVEHGWWDDGFGSPLEHGVGGDFLASGGVGDVFPEGWEGGDFGVDYARRLQHNHAVPKELELPRDTWGIWGQEGPRIFDETCYMRHEEVLPVRAFPFTIMLCRQV